MLAKTKYPAFKALFLASWRGVETASGRVPNTVTVATDNLAAAVRRALDEEGLDAVIITDTESPLGSVMITHDEDLAKLRGLHAYGEGNGVLTGKPIGGGLN